MKKILIISPHFPPSNLAAVHRSRFFAQHLPSFGWEPVILTVDEKYYEEKTDPDLLKLLPASLRIEKVPAIGITKNRIIGDIGLRAFFQLYKKAKDIIKKENIRFLYLPIPSFYIALLGRWLNKTTGIAYGIDYIDPWVHTFPGSEKIFSRHWLSTKLARLLEPIAIKKAVLITGVAEGYYKEVLMRNPHLAQQAIVGAMPYGGEEEDHLMVEHLKLQPYLFNKKNGTFQFVYAGAMLPKAYKPLEAVMKAIAANPAIFDHAEFHFIGTGKTANDPRGYNIRPLAEKYGLWQKTIFEYPQRIAYLDVLVHLNNADAIFILGSTESHYTPSKTYQGVLSGKPLLTILHKESSAVKVIRDSGAGMVLDFDGESGIEKIENNFASVFEDFILFAKNFRPEQVNRVEFDRYSAYNVTKELAGLLDKAIIKAG